jgi:two-component system cell cycle sensor histidine kinase/response regulator CckA
MPPMTVQASGGWRARLDDAFRASRPDDARGTIAVVLSDMADQQENLRQRLEMMSEASFEGILIHEHGIAIDANQRFCEMLGFPRDEVIGADMMQQCVAPEDLPAVHERVANRYEGEYLITGVRKDGSRFRAGLQAKEGRLGDRPVRVLAVRDVTERERTNELLRESEARFRELADGAFDLTLFSRGSLIVDVRGASERLLGRTSAELIGRSVYEFMAPSAVPAARQMIEEERLGFIDVMAVHANGELVPTRAVVVASTLNGQPVRVSGVNDLRPSRRLEAERRGLEQQLQRAQRLDSLGVLAGGIAHDFNNLLTGILGNADFLHERLADPGAREAAAAIMAAAERAATLTRQMLAYAGQRDLGRRAPIVVGDLVRELRALLDATLSKKASLELDIEPGTVVLGDRATISQVLMNLLTNASDALGERPGVIAVRARRVRDLDARWDGALGATVRPGSWVFIEVRDTGVGMDEATRGRVFEPFFTTKEAGHGLGLAACLGIVSAHGGAVLVETELGSGSCFSVLLPASDAAERENDSPLPRPTARPCRILVIDDEAVVRAQLRRSLELRGYVVAEASNGTAGLAALTGASAGGPLDVAILDMTMPDLDGAEVLLRARAAGARIPIIVSSGYLDVAVERRLPRDQFQGFLPKPYSATDLVNAIESALALARDGHKPG